MKDPLYHMVQGIVLFGCKFLAISGEHGKTTRIQNVK